MRHRVTRPLIFAVLTSIVIGLTPLTAGASPSVTRVAPADTAYGYSSVDPFGNYWVADYSTDTVARISPSGAITTFDVASPWALTTDAQGNVFVNTWGSDNLYEIPASGGTPFLAATSSGFADIYGLAMGPAGGFYTAFDGGGIDYVSSSGAVTHIVNNSDVGFECGLQKDAQGNLYSCDSTDVGAIYRITPSASGTSATVATIAISSSLYYPTDVTVAPDGTLYTVDDYGNVLKITPSGTVSVAVPFSQFPASSQDYYGTLAFSPLGSLFVGMYEDGSVYRIDGLIATRPTGLAVSRSATTLTVTWHPVAGSAPYVCSLLYGFNSPSGFTVTTSSDSCTFYGLPAGTSFLVSVAGNSGNGPASEISAPGVRTSIVCVRRHHVRHVHGLNPHCPARWHLRHHR